MTNDCYISEQEWQEVINILLEDGYVTNIGYDIYMSTEEVNFMKDRLSEFFIMVQKKPNIETIELFIYYMDINLFRNLVYANLNNFPIELQTNINKFYFNTYEKIYKKIKNNK